MYEQQKNGIADKKGEKNYMTTQLQEVQVSGILVLQRNTLVEALKKLSLVINNKASHPILTTIHFEITSKEIVLTATDSDNIAIVRMDNDYHAAAASFLLNHKQLSDFLKKSKAELIEISKDEKEVTHVKAANINYKMVSSDASEYPHTPNTKFESVELEVNDFKNAIKQTTYAAAISESRPVLQAMHVTYNENGLTFLATDSHRLARYQLQSYKTDKTIVANPQGMILDKVVKLISKAAKTATIGFSERYTQFKFDDIEYWIKNIEGNYPETSRLIPDSFDTEMELKSSELVEAIAMLSLVPSDRYGTIRLAATDTHKSVHVILAANDATKGSKMDARLSTNNLTGKDLAISFSSTYFSEALKALNCTEIEASFTGPMRPFILKNKKDMNGTHLILPIRSY